MHSAGYGQPVIESDLCCKLRRSAGVRSRGAVWLIVEEVQLSSRQWSCRFFDGEYHKCGKKLRHSILTALSHDDGRSCGWWK